MRTICQTHQTRNTFLCSVNSFRSTYLLFMYCHRHLKATSSQLSILIPTPVHSRRHTKLLDIFILSCSYDRQFPHDKNLPHVLVWTVPTHQKYTQLTRGWILNWNRQIHNAVIWHQTIKCCSHICLTLLAVLQYLLMFYKSSFYSGWAGGKQQKITNELWQGPRKGGKWAVDIFSLSIVICCCYTLQANLWCLNRHVYR